MDARIAGMVLNLLDVGGADVPSTSEIIAQLIVNFALKLKRTVTKKERDYVCDSVCGW